MNKEAEEETRRWVEKIEELQRVMMRGRYTPLGGEEEEEEVCVEELVRVLAQQLWSVPQQEVPQQEESSVGSPESHVSVSSATEEESEEEESGKEERKEEQEEERRVSVMMRSTMWRDGTDALLDRLLEGATEEQLGGMLEWVCKHVGELESAERMVKLLCGDRRVRRSRLCTLSAAQPATQPAAAPVLLWVTQKIQGEGHRRRAMGIVRYLLQEERGWLNKGSTSTKEVESVMECCVHGSMGEELSILIRPSVGDGVEESQLCSTMWLLCEWMMDVYDENREEKKRREITPTQTQTTVMDCVYWISNCYEEMGAIPKIHGFLQQQQHQQQHLNQEKQEMLYLMVAKGTFGSRFWTRFCEEAPQEMRHEMVAHVLRREPGLDYVVEYMWDHYPCSVHWRDEEGHGFLYGLLQYSSVRGSRCRGRGRGGLSVCRVLVRLLTHGMFIKNKEEARKLVRCLFEEDPCYSSTSKELDVWMEMLYLLTNVRRYPVLHEAIQDRYEQGGWMECLQEAIPRHYQVGGSTLSMVMTSIGKVQQHQDEVDDYYVEEERVKEGIKAMQEEAVRHLRFTTWFAGFCDQYLREKKRRMLSGEVRKETKRRRQDRAAVIDLTMVGDDEEEEEE
jgi:hypothetical protein